MGKKRELKIHKATAKEWIRQDTMHQGEYCDVSTPSGQNLKVKGNKKEYRAPGTPPVEYCWGAAVIMSR